MFARVYYQNTLFRGQLNDLDSELDFGDVDTRVFELTSDVNALQPNRYPQLKLDYLGVTGEIEIIFTFRTTWEDRQADISHYHDEVQEVIENGLNCIITEIESLGQSSG